ncbi:CapA family protein [Streptomyces sp. NPDC006624]|uniref:CapA family protein n=1 Tax=unclassified Streptomyces TaxID=2593676 RepID=UPI0033BB7BAC
MGGDVVTLFLCGDVMLGRGVDQILAHPGEPALREAYVDDARTYVRLAESVHGPVPAPAGPSWPWGEALRMLEETAPDARIVNLETSVTRCGMFARGKEIHYRMNPANLAALAVARPDVTVLSNNHVLDFERPGLLETLDVLARAGLRTAGAGRDAGEAYAPVTVPLPGGRRLGVSALGARSSGIPPGWAATADRPGVAYVPDLSPAAADAVARRTGQAGGLTVVSVHWGSNWGYHVPREQVRFAHALVDGGAAVVHGHSSHHARPLEVYQGRLILYGCGDFVDDYEGISGYEEFRDDLRLAYLVSVEADSGRLAGLRMVPFRARRMRLEPASGEDREWLCRTLNRISGGPGLVLDADGSLVLPVRAR